MASAPCSSFMVGGLNYHGRVVVLPAFPMMLTLLTALSLAAAPAEVVKTVSLERSSAVSGDKLVDALEAHVDFAELSKRALGDEWAKLDKAKQQEFVSTMRALLKASWLQKLLSADRAAGTKFGAEAVNGDEATVETTVDLGDDTLPVVYHLRRSGSGWKIYDIVTDGASLIDLYRAEFKKQLAKGGYDGLLKTLKAKVAQQQTSATAATAAKR